MFPLIEFTDKKGKRVFGEYRGKSKDGLTVYVKRSGCRQEAIHREHVVHEYDHIVGV